MTNPILRAALLGALAALVVDYRKYTQSGQPFSLKAAAIHAALGAAMGLAGALGLDVTGLLA